MDLRKQFYDFFLEDDDLPDNQGINEKNPPSVAKQSVIPKITQPNFSPTNKILQEQGIVSFDQESYQTSWILIGFFILTLFMIFSPLLMILFVIASALIIYDDAKKMGAGNIYKNESLDTLSWSPTSWALIVLLLWIIGYPLYLIKRKEIFEKSQTLRQNLVVPLTKNSSEYPQTQDIPKTTGPSSQIQSSPLIPNNTPIFCPACRSPMDLSDKFCRDCGEKGNPAMVSAPSQTSPGTASPSPVQQPVIRQCQGCGNVIKPG